MDKKLILIDRQYGSGGREIGKLIAQRKGIPFYDGQMLFIAAEKYGLNPGVMQEYDEKNVKSMIYMIAMTSEYQTSEEGRMLPQKIYYANSETIKRLANEVPCVIMGRCADYILKDQFDFVNLFVYSSEMKDRVKRTMEVDQLREKDAVSHIKKKEKSRKEYYNFHTDGRWGEVTNYDICLNTSRLSYEQCVKAIEDIM